MHQKNHQFIQRHATPRMKRKATTGDYPRDDARDTYDDTAPPCKMPTLEEIQNIIHRDIHVYIAVPHPSGTGVAAIFSSQERWVEFVAALENKGFPVPRRLMYESSPLPSKTIVFSVRNSITGSLEILWCIERESNVTARNVFKLYQKEEHVKFLNLKMSGISDIAINSPHVQSDAVKYFIDEDFNRIFKFGDDEIEVDKMPPLDTFDPRNIPLPSDNGIPLFLVFSYDYGEQVATDLNILPTVKEYYNYIKACLVKDTGEVLTFVHKYSGQLSGSYMIITQDYSCDGTQIVLFKSLSIDECDGIEKSQVISFKQKSKSAVVNSWLSSDFDKWCGIMKRTDPDFKNHTKKYLNEEYDEMCENTVYTITM